MLLTVIERVVLAAGSFLTIASSGCSFGYQSVYEGDVRFEHCYRLDEEQRTPLAEKQQCWTEWVNRYTYGQTRDRITYALGRQRALSAPGAVAAAGGMQTARRIEVSTPTNASPQPTNAYAPPPQMMGPRDAGSADGALMAVRLVASSGVPSGAPGAACAAACALQRGTCSGACNVGTCSAACDDRYRSCMRACF